MKEIAITDHSDFVMRKPMTPFRDQGYPEGLYEFYPSGARYDLKRWQNVHNDVKVIFGVEADVMNEQGEVCFTIQGQKPDFILLALHSERYRSEPETATLGLVNAIEKYHDEIVCICHPCDRYQFGEYIDIKKIVETANKYHIPIELNGKTMC